MTIEIPLTKGYVAIVDDEDADLAAFKWNALISKSGGIYGKRWIRIDGKRYCQTLHRAVMSRVLGRPLLRSEEVDHIHGNTLDNRRSELRLATSKQNKFNAKRRKDNTSGFKGVYWNKKEKKWIAQIKVDQKRLRLGGFTKPEDAHEAYRIAVVQHRGEFANSGE